MVGMIKRPIGVWFSVNHTVSNPTIGYGLHTIEYANGKRREFFQIGVSGNKTGISVYILGLKDKKYLAQTYGKKRLCLPFYPNSLIRQRRCDIRALT